MSKAINFEMAEIFFIFRISCFIALFFLIVLGLGLGVQFYFVLVSYSTCRSSFFVTEGSNIT